MGKVLYITYDGLSDPLGQSQIIPYLIGLSKANYDITILSSEKKDRLKELGEIIQKLLDENGIVWHHHVYSNSPPVLSTFRNIKQLRKTALALQAESKFDIVHCRSYLASLIGNDLKERSGVKFIFDMRGFWVDERVEGKIWNLRNPIYYFIYNYFKKKERLFLHNADHVISLTHKAIPHIEALGRGRKNKIPIDVIPCCADLVHFNTGNIDPTIQNNARASLNIKNEDKVLSYLGSIGTWYRIDAMLEFFEMLLTRDQNYVFLFITPDKEAVIRSIVSKYHIPQKKILIIFSPYNAVPSLIGLSDYSMSFINPVTSKTASSPTKQGEVMGMGIPMICNAGIGDTESIFDNDEIGYVANGLNKGEYKRIIDLMVKREIIDNDRIANHAKKWFSLEEGIKKYQAVYEKVLAV